MLVCGAGEVVPDPVGVPKPKPVDGAPPKDDGAGAAPNVGADDAVPNGDGWAAAGAPPKSDGAAGAALVPPKRDGWAGAVLAPPKSEVGAAAGAVPNVYGFGAPFALAAGDGVALAVGNALLLGNANGLGAGAAAGVSSSMPLSSSASSTIAGVLPNANGFTASGAGLGAEKSELEAAGAAPNANGVGAESGLVTGAVPKRPTVGAGVELPPNMDGVVPFVFFCSVAGSALV